MTFGRGLLWVATCAALALLARSLLLGPVPLWVTLVALASLAAIVAAGVFVPQLGMFANVAWRGRRDRGEIALTFDDGPHARHTRRVLEALDRAGAKATFFVVGEKVEALPGLVAEIAARGHDLGVHGWAHDRFLALRSPAAVAEDLARTLDAIERAAGVRPRFFRPPVGITSPRVADGARRAGLEIVAWSVKGRDGLSSARPERVARRVADALAPGSIVLLHDAAEHDDFEPAGIEALPRILSAASDKRLRVVPLVELLGARE